MKPKPPLLIIRERQSFWVERSDKCSATLQAFAEGCFNEAYCYDATGGLWPIVAAKLERAPSFVHRALPWLRVPVELRFGPRTQVDTREVTSRLAAVLESDGEFCDQLRGSPTEVLRSLEAACTPTEVIRIASEHAA